VQNSLVVIDGGVHGFGTTDKTVLDQMTDRMVDFIIAQKK
jgi:hypothetical protein